VIEGDECAECAECVECAECDDRPLDDLCKFCRPLEGGNLLEPIKGFDDIDW